MTICRWRCMTIFAAFEQKMQLQDLFRLSGIKKALREYDSIPQTKTEMTNFFFLNFLGFLGPFDVKRHQKRMQKDGNNFFEAQVVLEI